MNDVAGLVWYNKRLFIVHGSFSGELAINGKQWMICLGWKIHQPRHEARADTVVLLPIRCFDLQIAALLWKWLYPR